MAGGMREERESMESVNARIRETHLGFEDHGVFTFSLMLDYGGSSQGFGHIGLGTGGERAGDMVLGVLKALELAKWEDLPGKYCRVRIGKDGMVEEIGHILKDQWWSRRSICGDRQ